MRSFFKDCQPFVKKTDENWRFVKYLLFRLISGFPKPLNLLKNL